MKFTLEYPSDVPDAHPSMLTGSALAQISRRAEMRGFEAVCLADHPAPSAKWFRNGGHDTFEPVVALAFAAAATTSLKLMTNLLVLPVRNPYLAAKELTTLDTLSGGRLIAGVGAGYLRSEFAALGVEFVRRPELFDEALGALSSIWRDPSTPVVGTDFAAIGEMRLQSPVQTPHPPLWIGGNSRAARRRVATFGSGWCPVIADAGVSASIRTQAIDGVAAFAATVDALAAELTKVDRSLSEIDIQVEAPPVDVADDESIARWHVEVDHLRAAGATWLCVHADARSVAAAEDFVDGYEALIARHRSRCLLATPASRGSDAMNPQKSLTPL
ncbi:TIGR03619 family F420-dependent LLM class oxidoreductase [Gordonia sp. HY002]|uniref:TIGR03619 family F420-dependent LLM class oxidoreductase n=1 Tax=Gordonia zhenghanii TaxID=2911516 RepID=UPI001EF104B2|nr:TIGR03619 family F420-dependent LLM class oxidoreductase [Gordonia zhenghanii]MCF8568774.1 TIGR03619 family F420-dependent LLM class oxidoreductase [Gordonia zhenghanii]MCF8606107.1 TIGR03619 family F420-dependent LLM class oxidoreductase [Gordonia zhenghanii]